MTLAGRSLSALRHVDRRTHLHRDRGRDLVVASVVDLLQGPEETEPIRDGGLRIRLERTAGRGHGPVDVGDGAERDHGAGLLGGRIDDLEVVGARRCDPLPVDVELSLVEHGGPLILVLAPEQLVSGLARRSDGPQRPFAHAAEISLESRTMVSRSSSAIASA